MDRKLNIESITAQQIEQVEELVGNQHGVWDCSCPYEILAASVAVVHPQVTAEADAWKVVKRRLNELLPFNSGEPYEHTTKLIDLFCTIMREEHRLEQLEASLSAKPEGG